MNPKKPQWHDDSDWLSDFQEFADPGSSEVSTADPDWQPDLHATQRRMYDCTAKYILAHGEKYTGKTFVLGGHKLVNHCYRNFNALALIIVGVRSQAKEGGVWHKLQVEVLPEWKEKQGLVYTDPRLDTQRYEFIHIQNRFGGWSKIILMSMEHGGTIKRRARQLEPSYVFVDEVTLMPEEVFRWVALQVGRNTLVDDVQQWTGATNPDGPEHWAYKRFFDYPRDTKSGRWNKDYAVFHLPFSENARYAPKGYLKNIKEIMRDDPIEYDRMVNGKWISRPTGDAILSGYYTDDIIIGDNKRRLMPRPEWPVQVGYDLGQVNNAIIFLQHLVARDKSIWIIFDEMVYINRALPYPILVRQLLNRLVYWNTIVKKPLQWHHISDKSAFDQFRPEIGSYDSFEVERLSRVQISARSNDYPDIEPINMQPAPKYQGSVKDRTKIMRRLLTNEELYLSWHCSKTRECFLKLESEKPRKDRSGREIYDPESALIPRRSKHIHPWDALTYVIHKIDPRDSRYLIRTEKHSEVFQMGGV